MSSSDQRTHLTTHSMKCSRGYESNHSWTTFVFLCVWFSQNPNKMRHIGRLVFFKGKWFRKKLFIFSHYLRCQSRSDMRCVSTSLESNRHTAVVFLGNVLEERQPRSSFRGPDLALHFLARRGYLSPWVCTKCLPMWHSSAFSRVPVHLSSLVDFIAACSEGWPSHLWLRGWYERCRSWTRLRG